MCPNYEESYELTTPKNPAQLVYPAKKQFIVTLPNTKVVNVDVYSRLKR